MPNQTFPHLFLPGPSSSRDDYSSPRTGGGSLRLKPQDRLTHAEKIKNDLENAWQNTDSRHAAAHSTCNGAYLEFSSEPGFDLVLKSLEARSAGIKLLNVKKDGVDGAETITATVFVPREKSAHFLRKVTEYATRENPTKADGTATAKNAPMVNSIGAVRAALLESSFWQDAPGRLPTETPDWVEVWLSTEDLNAISDFREVCEQLQIQIGDGILTFPERTVLLLHVSRDHLELLIEHSELIAEFRAANEVATFYIEEENKDQAHWVNHLKDRTVIENIDSVTILLLDHGVSNGHQLLESVLPDENCHSIKEEWGVNDDHGHGTQMAGTAAYGDLLKLLHSDAPIIINHGIESSKILPPPPEDTPKRLWGDYTSRGISEAEYRGPPNRKRIICMAVTSSDNPRRGRPSSWSGMIDELSSGYSDDTPRLIIISSGNVTDPDDWKRFPGSNITSEVQDPAQAWNALTVGAYTEKTRITDSTLTSYSAIAECGDISPLSSTSATWPARKWPIKPDVLFEGGNIARGPNNSVFDTDDLKSISTYRDPQVAQFTSFNATSSAAAQAAWMAARIQSTYPDAWSETIRALMIHSADWTETQKRNHLRDESKSAYYELTKVCGYGVPNLQRALTCAENSLSLIAEATIQPFTKHESQSRYISKDMHIYKLPWPVDVLRDLGETPVQMRITLSYFIEPSPGEVGWKDRYRYASHALRFELNGSGEEEPEFIQRINRKAREDDEAPGTTGASDHWTLGEARNVGSIHSDIWTGTAAQLATSNLIAVHPAVGWWRDRHHLGKFNKETRYSLIVSFTLPEENVDIYTPVAIQLGIPSPVAITITP